MTRTRVPGDTTPEVEVIEVRADGSPAPPRDPFPTTGDILRRMDELASTGFDHARNTKAARGPRLGTDPEQPTRRGRRAEVLRAVPVSPRRALHLLRTQRVFESALRRVRVDPSTMTVSGRAMRWNATIRTSVTRRRRAATLEVSSSPSSNLTVIQLLPDRRVRGRGRWFVKLGVRDVDALSDRLIHLDRTASSPRHR